MEIHRKLKQLRIQKGYTIVGLSKKVGVCSQYLGNIENGRKTLSYKMAFKISYYLDTTPDKLFLEDFKK